MGVNLKNNNKDIKSISPGQEEFLKNRKKKSKAIAIILFLLVFIFFLTTVIKISSNIS
tara:strand:+ start:406 stop:579 length:174 start_codon:yes stop_codon:yes gene_type:complete